MISMPGFTSVALSATSVTCMMSMPGAISTNSDAWPGIGRKPCDDRPEERRVLRLQAVEEDVAAKFGHGSSLPTCPTAAPAARASSRIFTLLLLPTRVAPASTILTTSA